MTTAGLIMPVQVCVMAVCLALVGSGGGVMGSVTLAKHQDLLASSGLLSGTHQLKFSPGNSRGAFPNTTAGTFFSGAFSDHAVLQRAPAKAAVYGVVIGAEAATTVAVTVTPVGGAAYTIAAVVEVTSAAVQGGKYAKWKALLKPTPAGGNFTISATCASCANGTDVGSSTLVDVTFGDIWFCSGE